MRGLLALILVTSPVCRAFPVRTDYVVDGSQNYRHKSWKRLYWKYPLASIGLTAMVYSASVTPGMSANTIDPFADTLQLVRGPCSTKRAVPHGDAK
jgi:hypothetical protein